MTQVTLLVQAWGHGLQVRLRTNLSQAVQAQAHLMVCHGR